MGKINEPLHHRVNNQRFQNKKETQKEALSSSDATRGGAARRGRLRWV